MEIPYTGLRNLEKIDYGHIWGKSGLKAAAILTCYKEGVFIEVKKDIMEFVGPAYHWICWYFSVSERFKVNGQSMNPTLKDGQKLIMKKFQKNDKLHRGDVVIIKVTLKDKEYDFIKRVIALPREHLEIKNHKVYINGKYLEDEGSTMGEEDCVIPDDSIYVMGDNRDHSLDSRKLGTMKISKVVARKVIPEKKL